MHRGIFLRLTFVSLFLITAVILAVLVLFPEIDLAVSSLFHCPELGFFLGQNPILLGFKYTAFEGARILAITFLLAGGITLIRKKPLLKLPSKAWFFLLCCLLVGPGLFANVVLKDNWGRARPRDIEYFGSTQTFTPAGYMTDQCDRNCSFVSGDASFGFFLTSIAFLVGRRRQKTVFWASLGVGSLFAVARILLGAHFISDILFALVLIMLTNSGLHAAFYGRKETVRCWRDWLSISK